jgi:hypothetical protein
VKKLLYILMACVGAFGASDPSKLPAGTTFKYINDEGIVVLSNSIPPEFAYKGYTVINPDGTVSKVVPRQLSPKEIEERDRKLAEEEEDKRRRDDSKHKDADLLKLYASPADVEQARDRKMRSIESVIATTKANIVRLRQQKQHLEEQAADRERQGLLPSPEILHNLEVLTQQIADKEHEVEMRQLEQDQTREQFQQDLERIQLLLGPAQPVASAPAAEPTKTN